MQNLLFTGNPTNTSGHENRYTNTFKIKYNQEYCVYSGNHYIPSISVYSASNRSSSSYKYIREFLGRPENESLQSIIRADQICNQYLLELSNTFLDSNVPISLKNDVVKTRIKEVLNSYLTPCEDLRLRRGPHTRSALGDLTIASFLSQGVLHTVSRAGNFYWGGGIFGVAQMYKNNQYFYSGIFNPLAILAIKTEAVQLPRLAGLYNSIERNKGDQCNYHHLENKEGLFKLFVQAGFDYKDFPSQSFRKVYRNILLPFAEENNIEIVTVPDLKPQFFYQVDLPVFNNAIQKSKEEKEVMLKIITDYLSGINPEPEPAEETFQVLW
jgi:hypothetical protein